MSLEVNAGGNYASVEAAAFGIAAAGYRGQARTEYCGVSVTLKEGLSLSEDEGVSLSGFDGVSISGIAGYSFARIGGCAAAGPWGVIMIEWYDGRRPRIAVGHVCDDVEPDTLYRVDKNGKFVEVGSVIINGGI